MKILTVISHKPCWRSLRSGYATDGGFPVQMKALSELFERTYLLVPIYAGSSEGEIAITGKELKVIPLSPPSGRGIVRKLLFPFWVLRNLPRIIYYILKADVVHTPIPGDVGTIGMLLAAFFRKRLFVRHCGNWLVQKTLAERFWKWFMELTAGGRILCLATGGSDAPPSVRNPHLQWIFSTSLTAEELTRYGSARRLSGRTRLVIVCRQDKEKGTGVVIESLPEILKKYPEATLEVVGDGPAMGYFQELADRLSVTDRVTFYGKLNHEGVMRVLQDSDIFCYPTAASEGFPKVVLEALASGLPVITTRVSVLPLLIADGGGILLQRRDAQELAEAVCSLRADPARYEQMSSVALETARRYSLESWRDTIGHQLRRLG